MENSGVLLTAPEIWVGSMACLLLVTALTPVATAQTTANVGGTVRDQGGGVLPGVTVTVTNTSTNLGGTISGKFKINTTAFEEEKKP